MGPGPSTAVPELPRFFRQKVLYALLGLGVIYAAVAFAYPNPWVETPLGLVMLFFAPGYAVGALVLGSRPRWIWSLTFVMVVALSVAINVGLGIVLLRFSLGLPATVFSIISLVLVLLAILLARLPATTPGPSRFRPYLWKEFRLEGHSPAQRAMAYGLIVAIAFVLVAIVYLASVSPNQGLGVSLGLVGPGGVTNNLPVNGTVNSTVQVWAVIGNNGTSQTLTLVVESALAGTTPSSYTPTNWTYPIHLGNGVTSAYAVGLSPGESFTVHGQFVFATTGSFTMRFYLENAKAQVLNTAAWTMNIK